MIARVFAVIALVSLSAAFLGGCASNGGPGPAGGGNVPADEAAPVTGGALFDMN